MKHISLSTKLLWASGIIFILFFLSSILVFYQGQTRLTTQEMDRRLKSESITLASLVNLNQRGEIDFEFSSQFLNQYERLNVDSFFKYYNLGDGTLLRESNAAPSTLCDLAHRFRSERIGDRNFRIFSHSFIVEEEAGQDIPLGTVKPRVCVIVGTDEEPYRQLILGTIYTSLPFLLLTFAVSLLLLRVLIHKLTRDLSTLTQSLAKADFGATRSFPKLFAPQTLEVTAVVDKLESLHRQATIVYEEMLLFIARAAHQLKTPLAAMQTTYEVLVRRDRTKEELLEGMADLNVGLRQINHLTQKLIASSRISFQLTPELVAIDLSEFFENLWKLFQYQANVKGITFDLDIAVNASVLANEYVLSEVFGNLIENAILYAGSGTNIHVSWSQDNGSTAVRVADSGPGFPKEVQDHLFEPFFRGDERVVNGSGLGLSIVRSAVLTLGGRIRLVQTGSAGSIMEVVLRSSH